ncbi:MAG: tyrosine-protein phosphatase [Paeniglutamicibacter sp.]
MTLTSLVSPFANLRDLGHLPVAGGRVRPTMLWRADDIASAPAHEIASLAASGLGTVLDLRSAGEVERSGSGPADGPILLRHHLPLTDDSADPQALAALFAATRTPADVGSWYARLFRDRAPQLVRALALIADAPGGVLFHCAAGKDRTGVLAAAILAVLGAHPETIIDDYAATHANVPAVLARLGAMRSAVAVNGMPERPAGHPMLGAHAGSMAAMLADLERDGGPVAVLHSAGHRAETTVQLQERLVEA